ncbi:somatostatin 6 [Denticeps clupeoides]|uniref:somatostatin 6 n=1 Tax=Denticeps clupeoides TaxID=299321 RepID=UPI0010A4322D|nr:somatostatin-2-like [Denticeps clupeoides]
MTMGQVAEIDACSVLDSSGFTMRVLVSLVPLGLVLWSGEQTRALPIQENLPSNESLANNRQDLLLKIQSQLAAMNLTEEDLARLDLEQLLNGKLVERSTPQERPPCKNFFWKTLSCRTQS